MGSCSGKHKTTYFNQDQVFTNLKNHIQQNSSSEVKKIIKQYFTSQTLQSPLDINKPAYLVQGFYINALSYSLNLNHPSVFQTIFQYSQPSLEILEQNIRQYGKSCIGLICQSSSSVILKIFLPHYLSRSISHQSLSIQPPLSLFYQTFTPMQLACMAGNLDVIKYLYVFFNTKPPLQFDVHAINSQTGENGAFFSLKSGSFETLKFIHTVLKGNFLIKNLRGENALVVAAVGSKKNKNVPLEVFRYLIEVIKVDITEQYQEVLLILCDVTLIQYLEFQLKQVGIFTSKIELENERFERNKTYNRSLSVREDQKMQSNFISLFTEEVDEQLDIQFDGVSRSISHVPEQASEQLIVDINSFQTRLTTQFNKIK